RPAGVRPGHAHARGPCNASAADLAGGRPGGGMTRRPGRGGFVVILGPDYTGKSTALRTLAARGHPVVAGDDERFPLLGSLRRLWLAEVRPNAPGRYSAETAAAVIHPLVLHMH